MRFRYTLQKIVDLKSNEKMQAEWLLAEAMNKLHQEEHTLQELLEMESTLQDHLLKLAENQASVHELQTIQHYLTHIKSQIQQKSYDVKKAQGVVEQKQHGLTSKMLEEKVWNRAREKAHDQFMLEFHKREQKELDEIAALHVANS